MQNSLEDPISASIKDTIVLFKEEFSTVTFPDVSESILEDLAEKVKKNAQDLEEANNRIAALRDTLESSQNELSQKCMRGLAYAKVYAENNEELLEKISKINFGKTTKAPKKSSVEKSRAERSENIIVEENSSGKKSVKQSQKTDVVQIETT